MTNLTVDELSDKISDFIKTPHVVSSTPDHLDLAIAIIVLEYRMRGYVHEYLSVNNNKPELRDYNKWYNNNDRVQNPSIVEKYQKGDFYTRIKPIADIRDDVIHANSVHISAKDKEEYINTIKDFCDTFPEVRIKVHDAAGVTEVANVRVDLP